MKNQIVPFHFCYQRGSACLLSCAKYNSFASHWVSDMRLMKTFRYHLSQAKSQGLCQCISALVKGRPRPAPTCCSKLSAIVISSWRTMCVSFMDAIWMFSLISYIITENCLITVSLSNRSAPGTLSGGSCSKLYAPHMKNWNRTIVILS